MSGLFDASRLTAFGDALLAKGVARRALISASVKKGAQNVKNSIRDDLNGSGNAAFRRIPITYTVSEDAGRITAEIGPTKGGAGSLANIAFFGTARGGGTHRFYEHGEEELPKLAEYVASAAVAAARWFCANTVWITLTARRMSAVMGYRCNRT